MPGGTSSTPGSRTRSAATTPWLASAPCTRSLTIDNAAAEQAIRPLCVGRRNWLHLGGDGGLRVAAVLLSIATSVRRHALDPWAYLTNVLTELPARRAGADLGDLLPDAWAKSRGETYRRAG
ncbi:transposase domain-containing protein [Tautonia plasticadhaerens]|uniref:transposase domain-containing protein n=1 Tax=Tautonia plasticadhaerens TaxID=2527974 RepID=UPI00119D64DF